MAMVLACMAIGVCLGACMAFLCHQQEFMNLPWLKHMVEVSEERGYGVLAVLGVLGVCVSAHLWLTQV